MRRLFAACALAFALLAAGCAQGSPEGPRRIDAALSGALTIWTDQGRQPVVAALAGEFQKATGVTVTVQARDASAVRDDFSAAAPAGEGPDVLFGSHAWTGTLVDRDAIAPIDLRDTRGWYADVAVRAFTVNGTVYGVPYAYENVALVRNTGLAPQAPATWDDLVATGKDAVATRGATNPLLVQLDAVQSDPYHLYPLQASYGAMVFPTAADGSYDATTTAMGGDNGARFARALASWGADGLLDTTLDGATATQRFAEGAAPYIITGPWNVGAFAAAGVDYAISEIPSAGGEPATPFVDVQGAFVSAHSDNPEAAAAFVVEYLGSELAQVRLAETGGRAPAHTAALGRIDSADIRAFAAVGAHGVPLPNVAAMDLVWADWGRAQIAVLTSTDADPAEVWQARVDAIQQRLTDARASGG